MIVCIVCVKLQCRKGILAKAVGSFHFSLLLQFQALGFVGSASLSTATSMFSDSSILRASLSLRGSLAGNCPIMRSTTVHSQRLWKTPWHNGQYLQSNESVASVIMLKMDFISAVFCRCLLFHASVMVSFSAFFARFSASISENFHNTLII